RAVRRERGGPRRVRGGRRRALPQRGRRRARRVRSGRHGLGAPAGVRAVVRAPHRRESVAHREDRITAAGTLTPPDAVFAPVRSQTAFEETVDRLGTAIKLGLLAPGSQLPAERELCTRMGIARSTLRQALTALTQSGHVFATRGRGGGTFVSNTQPPADPPSRRVLARSLEDFPAYRQADVRLHVGLAEATRSAALVRTMTDVQGAMSGLISYIAHP